MMSGDGILPPMNRATVGCSQPMSSANSRCVRLRQERYSPSVMRNEIPQWYIEAQARHSGLAIPGNSSADYSDRMGYSDVIKAARSAKELTQGQLAELVGVAQPTVQRWESGKRAPEHDTIPRLAEVLGIERHLLVDIDFEQIGLMPSKEGGEVIDLWNRIAERDRDVARDMLKALSRNGRNADSG